MKEILVNGIKVMASVNSDHTGQMFIKIAWNDIHELEKIRLTLVNQPIIKDTNILKVEK